MPEPRNASPSSVVWTIFWLVAGWIHLTQAIWLSGFTALPAGLGDGRFNHLLLEHGYQSLLGYYDWLSPGQFYPTPHTLGFSDTHVGTLPLYLWGRFIGLAPENAMQGWFLLCAGLNLWAGWGLLRSIGLSRGWSGPTAFIAFAGVPWVWMTGTHPQLLPLFPTLWSAQYALRFAKTKKASDLFIVAGGLAGQFAAGPYLAFFAGCGFGGIMVTTLAFRFLGKRAKPMADEIPPSHRRRLPLVLASLGLIVGLINVWVYANAVSGGMSRPMQEVRDLAPSWRDWFSAPPVHALYNTGWPGGSREHSEHVLFSGFLLWIAGGLALLRGLRRSAEPQVRAAAICAATAFLIVLGVVVWPNGFSLWVQAAELIEPLRAFRAIGRIAIITHTLLALSAGLLIAAWWEQSRRVMATLLMLGVIIEGLARKQPHYEVSVAQNRRDAIVKAWRAAGDREVLAWAPGFTNQHLPDQHLDAWAAALSLRRKTFNGYSGGAPGTHLQFLWSPTQENARGLAYLLSIPDETVSIVTQLSDADAAATGYKIFQGRPLQHLKEFEIQPASWTLFAPLETFEFDGIPYYQFTPNAEVRFRLPDEVRAVSLVTGLRPGSYNNGGDSDGYQFTWKVVTPDGHELVSDDRLINPRDEPSHRGFLNVRLETPTGSQRELVISIGPGPSGLNNWDWPLISRLRVER